MGPTAVYGNVNPSALDEAAALIMQQFDITSTYNGGLGAIVSYDSRDNVMNPKTGSKLELSGLFFDEALGGDSTFWSIYAVWSQFFRPSKSWVVAYNLTQLSTPGAPPSNQAQSEDLEPTQSGRILQRMHLPLKLRVGYYLRNRGSLRCLQV